MSRNPIRFVVLTGCFFLHTSAIPAADDLPPQSPADLVRGLRTAGLPDLALEYLADIGASSSPEAQINLLLERARLRVELANQESDEVRREELTSEAKKEFDEFLKKAPSHPRGAEAALSVAQLYALQANDQFARAIRGPAELRKAEAAKVRVLYEQAGARFASAIELLTKKMSSSTGEPKRELTRELLQAKLDAAINQYKLGVAYLDQTLARGAAIQVAMRGRAASKKGETALAGFEILSREDTSQPVCWIARAWLAECNLSLDSKKVGEDSLKAIINDHRKTNTSASFAGYRMARFFEVRMKFDAASSASDYKAVADACENWLGEFRSARPTPETYSVMFYRARSHFSRAMQVRAKEKEDTETKTKKEYVTTPEVIQLFRTAEAELQKLLITENAYTDQANSFRNVALRVIVGETVKPPMQYTSFEEANMAAMVQYMKISEAKTNEDRAKLIETTTSLLERARLLPAPVLSSRETQTANLMLISVYRMSGRSPEAAILAESFMRNARLPSGKAQFGRQALASYLESSSRVPANDPLGKRVDTDKAVNIAQFLDKEVPADPVAEESRIIIGDVLNRDGKQLEALETFARVTPNAARFAVARLQEGAIAYTLIRPLPPDSAEAKRRRKLEPSKKAELYARVTADLAAVPKPAVEASETDVATYLRIQLQLAQLHIAAGGEACVTAEKLIQDANTAIPTFPTLKGDEKTILQMQCAMIRIDAVFEQARLLLKAEKFKEAADKLAPLLVEVVSAGPAVQPGQSPAVSQYATRLDANRISYAVVPALNARVRDGDIAKAAELLDVLKKLGGDARRGIAAVFEVVELSRPQIDLLRKSNQVEAANKLKESVSQLVGKLAEEKNLSPGDNLNLGRAFLQVENYPKAIELLNRIPKPTADAAKWSEPAPKREETDTDETFKKKTDDWQTMSLELTRYRLACVERLRALRESGDLAGCEALMNEVMGKEQEGKQKGVFTRNGIFGRRPEFRREAILLQESKAQATEYTKATPLWARAIREWDQLNGDYRRILVQPEPKGDVTQIGQVRQQKDLARPLFFDTFYEKCRCQVAAFRHVNSQNPKGLESGMNNVARNMLAVEKANPDNISEAAHTKLTELLDATPELKQAYTAAGGKMFLTKPADDN